MQKDDFEQFIAGVNTLKDKYPWLKDFWGERYWDNPQLVPGDVNRRIFFENKELCLGSFFDGLREGVQGWVFGRRISPTGYDIEDFPLVARVMGFVLGLIEENQKAIYPSAGISENWWHVATATGVGALLENAAMQGNWDIVKVLADDERVVGWMHPDNIAKVVLAAINSGHFADAAYVVGKLPQLIKDLPVPALAHIGNALANSPGYKEVLIDAISAARPGWREEVRQHGESLARIV